MNSTRHWIIATLFAFIPCLIQAQPTVVISELFYDTPFNECAEFGNPHHQGEFVCLYNYGSSTVDISGWRLHNDHNVKKHTYTFPANSSIPAKGTLLIAYKASSFQLQNLFGVAAVPTGSSQRFLYQNTLILNNKGPYLKLLNAQGKEHDVVYYGYDYHSNGVLKAHNGKAGSTQYSVSLQRKNITTRDGKILFQTSDYVTAPVKLFTYNAMAQLGLNGELLTTDLNIAHKDAGVVDVNASGALSYSIPIEIPVAPGNMQPQLSLVYNSNGGYGYLGQGWSLAGISSINRMGKNMYFDEMVTEPNITSGDQYAWDGNRLLLQTGTHGKVGSIYKTEQENFAFVKITEEHNSSTGGGQFEAKTDKGITMQYAACQIVNTPRSFLDIINNRPSKKATFAWFLSNATDLNGNKIAYEYITDPSNGYCFPKTISYCYNNGTPQYAVRFQYEDFSHGEVFYVGGSIITNKKLLNSIRIYNKTTLLKEYVLQYSTDGTRWVEKVKELNGSGQDFAHYAFGKEKKSTMLSTKSIKNNFVYNPTSTSSYYGDYNGDGNVDVVVLDDPYHTPYTWRLYLGNGDGTFRYINTGRLPDNTVQPFFQVGDFDGDGKSELLHRYKGTYNSYDEGSGTTYGYKVVYYVLKKFNGSDFVNTSDNIPFYSDKSEYSKNEFYVADFDGDGRDELLCLEKNRPNTTSNVWFKAWNGATLGAAGYGTVRNFGEDVYVNNMSGGRKASVVIVDKDNNAHVYQKTQNYNDAIAEIYSCGIPAINKSKGGEYFWADFNGDGKSDLLSYAGDGKWQLYFSTGRGLAEYSSSLPFQGVKSENKTSGSSVFHIADLNGDGKADVLRLSKGGVYPNPFTAYYSNGCGSFYKMDFSNKYKISSLCSQLKLVDLTGDGIPEAVYATTSDAEVLFLQQAREHLPLASVANSFGQITNIAYSQRKSPVNARIKYPLFVIPNLKAVSQVYNEDVRTYYEYGLPIAHMQGRGFLGFEQITSKCPETNRKQTQTFSINTKYVIPYVTQIYQAQFNPYGLAVTTDNTYSVADLGGKRIALRLDKSTEKNDLTGVTTTKSVGYNSSGYISKDEQTIVDNTGEVARNEVAYTYTTIAGNANVYKPQIVENKQYYKGSLKVTTKQEFGYDGKGNLTSSTSMVNNQVGVSTTYADYTSSGLVQTVRRKAPSMEVVEERKEYDEYGRERKITDALGQSRSVKYNLQGWVTEETDYLGNTTTQSYDNYGRVLTTSFPTGERSGHSWIVPNPNNPECPPRSAYAHTTSSSIGASQVTYYNAYGKPLRTVGINALNQKVYNDTEYDKLQRVVRKSYPYYLNESKKWISYAYDEYGRLQAETDNNLLATRYNYSKLTTRTTNPAGQTTVKTMNGVGDVISSTDPAGNTVSYTYHSPGRPNEIVAAGASYTIKYDNFGNQSELNDPNAGKITYTYDGFGQLTSQTDAKGHKSYFYYDKLGRTTQSVTPEATYTYQFNNSGLESVKRNGVEEFANKYDRYGRVVEEITKIGGDSYAFTYAYNSVGQLQQKVYPNNFMLNFEYSKGALTSIAGYGNTLWKINQENAMGQPTQYSWGNGQKTVLEYNSYGQLQSKAGTGQLARQGYTFNPYTGNLSNRSTGTKTENFAYDGLNRLTGWQGGSAGYAANGNINSKSDVGTYVYNSQRPHAVAGVANASATIDATMQQDQRIAYDSKNRPQYIAQGADSLAFYYDYAGQRLYTKHYKNNLLYKTTHYVGSYEKEIYADNTTRSRCFVQAPTGLCAAYETYKGVNTLLYTHTDHLGSITSLTDANGYKLAEYSYDPWGKLRNPQTLQSYSFSDAPSLRLGRGFTGHEHLPEFGLINMNARLYDPILGRFLSADPYVTDVGYGQDFNRYTYARNNPLTYVDPEGENPVIVAAIVIGALAGGYTGYKVADAKGYNLTDWQGWGFMLGGALIGGASGYLGAGVAAGGGIMANTAGIVVGSYTFSTSMAALSGGMIQPNVNFGAASYNLGTGEWGYLGKRGNRWYENIGYGLGALANVCDAITFYDELRTLSRPLTSGLSDEELLSIHEKSRNTFINKAGSLEKDANYAGTSPSVNPEELRRAGVELRILDGDAGRGGIFGGYKHDIGYYNMGADGVRGVLFNTNVLQVDKNLVMGMRQLINAGNLSGSALTGAHNINILFSAVVGYKTLIQHQHLFNFIR